MSATTAANIPLKSSEQHQDLVAASVKKTFVQSCATRFENRLRAIVLTGSLARREASIQRDANGWTVLGDAEFIVVFKDGAQLPSARSIELLHKEVSESVASQGIQCQVGASFVHGKFLKAIEPSIFGYELRQLGEVAWGEPTILELVPQFSPTEIPKENAWRMLMNRMTEVLEPAAAANPQISVSRQLGYRSAKLLLDTATSFLVFAGEYRPTYLARAKALQDYMTNGGAGFLSIERMREFGRLVNLCTRFKLGTGLMGEEDSRRVCAASVDTALELLRWELGILTGISGGSDEQLWDEWMRRQPLQKRIRGWLVCLRECRSSSIRYLARWLRLFFKGSPRYCNYRATAALLKAMSATGKGKQSQPAWRAEFLKFSPILTSASKNDWRSAAHTVWRNYYRFLVNTSS